MTQDIDIKALIRTVPNFPKPGLLFRDITTLLKDAAGFSAVVEKLGAAYCGRPIDKIAAIESRGFIIGAALAYKLTVGFVPIRKQGKLPAENFLVPIFGSTHLPSLTCSAPNASNAQRRFTMSPKCCASRFGESIASRSVPDTQRAAMPNVTSESDAATYLECEYSVVRRATGTSSFSVCSRATREGFPADPMQG